MIRILIAVLVMVSTINISSAQNLSPRLKVAQGGIQCAVGCDNNRFSCSNNCLKLGQGSNAYV